MTPSEEMLMAYADGALSADDAAQVEAAMAADPALRQRVEAHRALRAAISGAYESAMAQTVPKRLVAAVGHGGPQSLPAWAAVAAALTVGVLAGVGGWSLGHGGRTGGADGRLARGALKAELDGGLASRPLRAKGVARVGLSYRTAEGYCRTFSVDDEAPWSGVACRSGDDWIIRTTVRTARAADRTAYRQAATSVPAPILATIEEAIVGEPLNAAQETAARAAGWR